MHDGLPPAAIATSALVKRFGEKEALAGLDLSIPSGCVYGVLGPNGAGKTTAVRVLSTLVRPDSGEATVLGHDVVREADRVRSRIAVTGQSASLDEDLHGRENLLLLGRLLGFDSRLTAERADQVLNAFDLQDAGGRKVSTYSGGMRRRLDIGASLLSTPDLLFLDEPTTGLDPRSRNQVWQLIRLIVDNGTTVVLTTQYMEEANHLADRIVVIDSGRAIAEGTPSELKSSVGAGSICLRLAEVKDAERAEEILLQRFGSVSLSDHDSRLLTSRSQQPTSTQTANDAASVLAELTRDGIALEDFSLGQPSLDEVFMALTQRKEAA